MKISLITSSHSLRARMSKMVLGALLFLSLAIVSVVWVTTLNAAKDEMARNSGAAIAVLEGIIHNSNEQFFQAAKVLTSDFDFKQAASAGNPAFLQQTLLRHKDRIGADVLAIVDLDGTVTGASDGLFTVGQPFADQSLLHAALEGDGGYGFYQADGRLLSLVAMPVMVPDAIGIALFGVEIDQQFVAWLSGLIGQELQISTVNLGQKQAIPSIVVSSLDGESLKSVKYMGIRQIDLLAALLGSQEGYVTDSNPVYTQPLLEVHLTLLTPLKKVLEADLVLLTSIAWLSLLAVAISFAISSFMASKIAHPLRDLVKSVELVAEGDYTTSHVHDSGVVEIDRLADAFRFMQGQVREREQHIAFQASHDTLTGFINRDRLVHILTQYLRRGETTALVQIKAMDLRDMFDIFGYQTGEDLIRAIASRLKGLGGVCTRIGGAEFVWMPPRESHYSTPTVGTLRVLREIMSTPFDVDQQLIRPDFALSALKFPSEASNSSEALMRLNIACDTAFGLPSRVQLYNQDMEHQYRYRLEIVDGLKAELAKETPNFTLHFQPKFRLDTLKPEKAEALLRWSHPELGSIPPDIFIGLAEQAELIRAITRWVIQQVIRQQYVWRGVGIDAQVSINLSMRDVEDEGLLPFVTESLSRYGLNPEVISFEVTESGVMGDPVTALRHLRAFRADGFSMSIDDFGTGYSSLAYLKSLPVDELKIDKTFILKLDQDATDQTIVDTVLSLAKRFGLETVAEGVETQAALELLRESQCEWAQGFYLSRPMAQEDFGPWLENFEVKTLLAKGDARTQK